MKTKHIQFVALENIFEEDTDVLHCPFCGKATQDREGHSVTPCSHLAFLFIHEVDEYAYISEEFKEYKKNLDEELEKEEIKQHGEGAEEDIDEFEYLENFIQNEEEKDMLVIEEIICGMACGPVSSSAYYGFTYGY